MARHRRRRRYALGVTLAVTLTASVTACALQADEAPEGALSARPPAVTGSAQPSAPVVRGARVAATPVLPRRLSIPAIGLDSTVEPVGLQPDGVLTVPDPGVVGWYSGFPRPGARGPAVLVGHVDGPTGPAVFAQLAGVRRGDQVQVTGAGTASVTFRVTSVRHVTKEEFPTEQVYGATKGPELRLITCGGPYDKAAGGYRDNVVVYASLVGT